MEIQELTEFPAEFVLDSFAMGHFRKLRNPEMFNECKRMFQQGDLTIHRVRTMHDGKIQCVLVDKTDQIVASLVLQGDAWISVLWYDPK